MSKKKKKQQKPQPPPTPGRTPGTPDPANTAEHFFDMATFWDKDGNVVHQGIAVGGVAQPLEKRGDAEILDIPNPQQWVDALQSPHTTPVIEVLGVATGEEFKPDGS